MFVKKIKRFWKICLFLFLISFLIINWNQVSWVFNYRVISGFFADFLKTKEKEIHSQPIFSDKEEESEFDFYEKENSLEISKIGISVPLIFLPDSDISDINEVSKALDRGAVHFPGSALPGQVGQTVILGHSAPSDWPKVKYDWVFSQLNELVNGDKIRLFFNDKEYQYIVIEKIFLERGEEIPEDNLTNDKNVLILISCWPPGKDIKRIALVAEKYK